MEVTTEPCNPPTRTGRRFLHRRSRCTNASCGGSRELPAVRESAHANANPRTRTSSLEPCPTTWPTLRFQAETSGAPWLGAPTSRVHIAGLSINTTLAAPPCFMTGIQADDASRISASSTSALNRVSLLMGSSVVSFSNQIMFCRNARENTGLRSSIALPNSRSDTMLQPRL